MVAIGGSVALPDALKQTHQSLDAVALMKPVTKYSVEIDSPDSTGEVVANAFRAAVTPRPGAAFIAFPQDVQGAPAKVTPTPISQLPPLGPAPSSLIERAAKKLRNAKSPVILLGLGASEPAATQGIRDLLKHFAMPAVGTFQGAGAISRQLLPLFFGRIGLFRNQPGDKLLAKADVVLTIGYDPVEYDPHFWNLARRASIIHLDDYPCSIDNYYQPEIELRGSVEDTLAEMARLLPSRDLDLTADLKSIRAEGESLNNPPAVANGASVHPLNFIRNLRSMVDDDTIISSDIGSNYIWMGRHFFDFEPRKLLFSNGQQTLGVGIPWAIAASLIHPGKKVVATVGDGGFLYSAMDLETATRVKADMTVFVFRDGTYNMVGFQQQNMYGRTSGVKFGPTDFAKYAESLGAVGLRVTQPSELTAVMRKALDTPGVVVVDVPIDYSKNVEIGQQILPSAWD